VSAPGADGRPAVFLDRDGTLVEEVDYLIDPGQVRLIPGAAAAVRRLNQAGWPVVIVTNQSMIARGMANERQLGRIHARLAELLSAEGAQLDGIYYCPHHPELGVPPYRAACDCR
jgi:D-glycero-D-manno-heptose 1,7-bisphosphate phosphatase